MKTKPIFRNLGANNHSDKDRVQDDYYATDPIVTKALLERESFSKNILEPSVGGGHIAEILKEHGHTVTGMDIVDRGYPNTIIQDFLDYNTPFDGDIVMNPPYHLALDMVQKALSIIQHGNKLAVLLRIQFLEGKKRYEFYQDNPPKVVYVFSSRVGCARNGNFDSGASTSAMCFCWFVWEKGYKGEPVIRWIAP